MKCHYEVLGVSKDANADDMKRSYRKLALQWHPDKNLDNMEEATMQFRLVQQAYEVLSDPQERAWYDKHREEILRGGLGQGAKYEDKSLNIFQYFDSSCYTGYGDDEMGFYTVYREVFKTIAEEDYQFMEDRESDDEMPDFGNSQSDYDEIVKQFYGYWESYCTAKSYVWMDEHDIRDAPNRRIRRMLEVENKKLRDAAKKERNEEVRALVAFVKKRDKRVQAQKKKQEAKLAELAKQQKERQERQKKERLKKLENYQEAEWSAMSALEKELENLEAHWAGELGEEQSAEDEGENVVGEGDEDYEEEGDELYCVACNKLFKTHKAMQNHENSKKHKENVMLLVAEMEEDEELINATADGTVGEEIDRVENVDEGSEGSDRVLETETAKIRTKLSKKQKKRRKQLAQVEKLEAGDNNVSSVNENTTSTKKLSKKERRRKKQEQEEEDLSDVDQEQTVGESLVDVAPSNIAADEIQVTDVGDLEVTPMDQGAETNCAIPNTHDDMTHEKNDQEETSGNQQHQQHFCNTCGQEFSSRNKMFQHLKATGHALRIDHQQDTNVVPGKSGKKNKKKKHR